MPPHLFAGMERAQLDDFLSDVYDMYLAVPVAHMVACLCNLAGPGGLRLFPLIIRCLGQALCFLGRN